MRSKALILIIMLLLSNYIEAQNSYVSDRLERIANLLHINSLVDTISDGYYDNQFIYKNHPIVVRIKDNKVEHIGIQLFSKRQRGQFPAPAMDFLERYLLELSIPLDTIWKTQTRMGIDGVRMVKGKLSFFENLPNDSLYSLSIDITDRKYNLKWKLGNKLCCSVSFPTYYDLISGKDRIECVNRLLSEVQHDSVHSLIQCKIDPNNLVKDTLDGYYILRGASYYTEELNSDRYYSLASDSSYVPYRDSLHIVETLSNLFTIPNYENNYTLQIRCRTYGFNTEEFSVPVSKWVNYCLNQGCTPYFGIINLEDNYIVNCLLVMRNEEMHYNHIMKMRINFLTLGKMDGVIESNLSCFIMTSKIKNLFKEYGK